MVALLASACRGRPEPGVEPESGATGTVVIPASDCEGELVLRVENENAGMIEILEWRANSYLIIGEMSKGTRTFAIRNERGVFYTVHRADTRQIMASENPSYHYPYRGVVMRRACIMG